MTTAEPRRDPNVEEMDDLSNRLVRLLEDEDLSEESITTITVATFILGWLWGRVYVLKKEADK